MTLEHFLHELTGNQRVHLVEANPIGDYALVVTKSLWYKNIYDVDVYKRVNEFENRLIQSTGGDTEYLLHNLRQGNTNLARLDWKVYRTRDELEAENAELTRSVDILYVALENAARNVLVNLHLDPDDVIDFRPGDKNRALKDGIRRVDSLIHNYIKKAEKCYENP